MKLFNNKFAEVIKASLDRINNDAGRFNIVFGLTIVAFMALMCGGYFALIVFDKIKLLILYTNNFINIHNEISISIESFPKCAAITISIIFLLIEIYICTMLSVTNNKTNHK